jgi:hypothetical protein
VSCCDTHDYLGELDVGHEASCKVFQHNTIGSGKKSQDMLDEVLLVVAQALPVVLVGA